MRYIGSKRCLIEQIDGLIGVKVGNPSENLTLLDLFSGTGVVAQRLKPKYEVITNDMMYFSYVLARGQIALNTVPDFRKLEQVLGVEVLIYLNRLGGAAHAGFIANNYSLHGSDRMYFTVDNAFKIDHIRATIEDWRDKYLDDDAYYYLLACLIEAVPFVSNTSGIYGAYLKTWDKRAFLDLTLKHPIVYDNGLNNRAFNQDANVLVDDVSADICYIDPPYNSRQYTSNYHLLDTIAYGDSPSIKGVTGMRFYQPQEKSLYCSKPNVLAQFDRLIRDVKAEHLVVSYSSDGIMSEEDMLAVLNKHCEPNSVELNKVAYRKYKSKVVKPDDTLSEYLFYARKPEYRRHKKRYNEATTPLSHANMIKRSDVLLASPLNYIGGKFKLLPQLLPHFPDDINELVDVFSGGLNIGINIKCQKLIANDINHFVVELLNVLGKTDIDELLIEIQWYISKYNLSKNNKEGFLRLRSDYNANPNPIALYALICHSFNYQFRFNTNLEYNNPFGKDRSFFSPNLRRKLILFNQRLSQIPVDFHSLPFQELIASTSLEVSAKSVFYCDPPYLLSTGSYNDGNRGFKDWNESQESALHEALDDLHAKGKRFMLSNVTEHKGYRNDSLIRWAANYNLINLDFHYDNASYNTKKSHGDFTQEVLIKNF